VVRAAPDGYTLGLFGAPSAINATLYDKLNFNFLRDIAPVAPIVRFPNIMVVNPSIPSKTLRDDRHEVGACAVSQRGGGDDRLAERTSAALFRHHGIVARVRESRQATRAGGHHRAAPGCAAGHPSFAEFVPGYEASAWFGVGAPRNTPFEIIDKLNKEINADVADPKMKARLTDLGGIALRGSPSDFGKLIVEETEKWGKVVKLSGAKLD
jgi:tripartite-type tricarboxylate transporter receptor subunit TctC